MQRPSLIDRLAARHAERAEAALLRRLRLIERAEHTRIVIDGRALRNFASNDYLGLAGHSAVRDALVRTAHDWGVGATAAHLLGGHRRPHRELEDALAEFCQRERALLFSTGYMANLGVLGALLGPGDLCLQDKLDHACLIDGARLAGAELKRYQHADVASARRQLESTPAAAALIASDGVFSMDGDVAPLVELAALARESCATLMIDDAHGFGVLGPEGRGSVAAAGLDATNVPIYMATLGKALGGFGAFVAGDATLIEGLIQFARTHVYTTALPPVLAAALCTALAIARHESWRRDKLAVLIRHFRRGAAERGLALGSSQTPIQPLLIGDSARAAAASDALEAAGFFVPAIRPPTVPAGSARLRVSLTALHQEHEVEALLDALALALTRIAGTRPPVVLAQAPARPAPRARRKRARERRG
jgi:8-amino-7-oxononanoate synthase